METTQDGETLSHGWVGGWMLELKKKNGEGIKEEENEPN